MNKNPVKKFYNLSIIYLNQLIDEAKGYKSSLLIRYYVLTSVPIGWELFMIQSFMIKSIG